MGGLVGDADWLYALDCEKGHLLAFSRAAPAPLSTVAVRHAAAAAAAVAAAAAAAVTPSALLPAGLASLREASKGLAAALLRGGHGGGSGASCVAASSEGSGGGSGVACVTSAMATADAKQLLREWAEEHTEDPYPVSVGTWARQACVHAHVTQSQPTGVHTSICAPRIPVHNHTCLGASGEEAAGGADGMDCESDRRVVQSLPQAGQGQESRREGCGCGSERCIERT